jgi:hypothetical protein
MSITAAITLPFESNRWKNPDSFALKVLGNFTKPEFYVAYPDNIPKDKITNGEVSPLSVSMRVPRNPLLWNRPMRRYIGVPRAALIVHFKVPAGWDVSKPFPDETQPYAYSRRRWSSPLSDNMDVYSLDHTFQGSSKLTNIGPVRTAIHHDARGIEIGRSIREITKGTYIYLDRGAVPAPFRAALALYYEGPSALA